jgi:dolichyl-phosphate beta-glucosyltransferase
LSLPEYVTVEPPRAAPGAPLAVSVVIPAYNETARIGPYLAAVAQYFSARGEGHEILVANDGSRDGTADLIRRAQAEIPTLGLVTYERNRGKGHAVRMGMFAARGAWRLFADADGSTPIGELERLREAARGADVVIGSRALPAPGIRRQIKPHRYVIGQVFRLIRQLLLRVDVADSQCGFKLFSAAAAETLFGAARLDGFAFDVELLYLAARAGFKVVEVPVNWVDSTSSRVSLLTDPFRMVRDMWRIRRRHRNTVLRKPGKWGQTPF